MLKSNAKVIPNCTNCAYRVECTEIDPFMTAFECGMFGDWETCAKCGGYGEIQRPHSKEIDDFIECPFCVEGFVEG